jgi:hypothetical protein
MKQDWKRMARNKRIIKLNKVITVAVCFLFLFATVSANIPFFHNHGPLEGYKCCNGIESCFSQQIISAENVNEIEKAHKECQACSFLFNSKTPLLYIYSLDLFNYACSDDHDLPDEVFYSQISINRLRTRGPPQTLLI